MNSNEHHYDALDEKELAEYSSLSWQVLVYVLLGIGLGFALDRLEIFGFVAEAVVRAIAGIADTLGLAIAGVITLVIRESRRRSTWANNHLPDWGDPKAVTWVIGGLVGVVIAVVLHALVFALSDDPFGPIGVIYAFGYSNLDNTMAGLFVLVAVLSNHGREGWRRYWRHPFFVGNAIMLLLIPAGALLIRLFAGFRPDLNSTAAIEAGLMDIDSFGAAVIFLVATRWFSIRVPYIDKSFAFWRNRNRAG